MTNRPNLILHIIIAGCLFYMGMPSAGHCDSAYKQLEDAAGHRPAGPPDPGVPVCAGCGLTNNNHKANCRYASQESGSPKAANPALVGMLAKQRSQERIWTEKIKKIEQALRKSDAHIQSANTIITKAQNTGKVEAEVVARQNLAKATKLKQDYLEQKRKAEEQLRRARETGKNLSVSLTDGSVPADVRGVVSHSAGEVSLLRTDSGSKATLLTASQVGCLAPGDEIQTGNDGRAELQILSGRGAMTMGENSKLKMEADNGDAEVIRTLEGKFHFVVEKLEKFQDELDHDLAAVMDKLEKISDDPKREFERYLKALKAKLQKKFEVKTRGGGTASIRGTEFVVNENGDGGCEFVVIDGKVEVTAPRGREQVLVETGHAVSISPDGKLSGGVRQLDVGAISSWREESP